MECKFARTRKESRRNSRINRYIMECKFIFCSNRHFFAGELIDTLWNVNNREEEIKNDKSEN